MSVLGDAVFGLQGQRLYDLKGSNIYKLNGDLAGHLSDARGAEKLNLLRMDCNFQYRRNATRHYSAWGRFALVAYFDSASGLIRPVPKPAALPKASTSCWAGSETHDAALRKRPAGAMI
jgi:hypothetical protein